MFSSHAYRTDPMHMQIYQLYDRWMLRAELVSRSAEKYIKKKENFNFERE